MQRAQHDSLALKEGMAALSRDAHEIRRVLSTIHEIADQTDVLALNASIEAARSGESGRPFAVVAGEVRKLTDKIMLAIDRVADAVQSIEINAENGLAQVDATVRCIEETSQCVAESGAALNDIRTLSDHFTSQIKAIAVASEQQAQSSNEITRAIGKVSAIAEQTTRSMVEAAKTVGTLANQSGVLNSLAHTMKQI